MDYLFLKRMNMGAMTPFDPPGFSYAYQAYAQCVVCTPLFLSEFSRVQEAGK